MLDACILESKVWVMAEFLDTIIDIYAEDNSDQLANEIKLLEKLQTLIPCFRNKVRSYFNLNIISNYRIHILNLLLKLFFIYR